MDSRSDRYRDRLVPEIEDVMRFTNGRWGDLSRQERNDVLVECARLLPQWREEERQNKARAEWGRICPPTYLRTCQEQLPDVEKFLKVQEWSYGPEGLLLVGSPRTGKTRSAWKLLERVYFEEKRQIIALSPMDLKLGVANAFREGTAGEWLMTLRRTPLLFLDDLDTVKLTEAVEEVLYDIFEWRPAHDLPIIVTLNQVGQHLAARMSTKERGDKIVQRMREACRIINFDS